jgi:hypothetical protein
MTGNLQDVIEQVLRLDEQLAIEVHEEVGYKPKA